MYKKSSGQQVIPVYSIVCNNVIIEKDKVE